MDVDAAQERGQPTVLTRTKSCLASCGTPCRIRLPSAALSGTSSDKRATEEHKRCVRGEKWSMSWERGDVAASMTLEDLFDQLNKIVDIVMFARS